MKFLSIILLFIICTACSEQSWTKDEQNDFVQACRTEGGTKAYCNCYKDVIMKNYPIAEDAEQIDFETKVELSLKCKNE